jgi:hypothetical protein
MEQRVNYIHYNPVEAQIVFHERDYVNSSYKNYEEATRLFVMLILNRYGDLIS